MMDFHSGSEVFEEYDNKKIFPTGDTTLNSLLNGGYRDDILYLLYGDRKIEN